MLIDDTRIYSLKKQEGLSLLEVIFAVMILLVLTVASAQMIRNGVDIQVALSEQARINHSMDVVIQKLTADLEHAYLVNRRRGENFYTERRYKTYFSLDEKHGSGELRFTTMNHRPLVATSAESDQSFVVYRVEKDDFGVSHLFRGETKIIPEDFENDIPMNLLARNIKSLKLEAWNGDSWTEDWNSNKSDFRDILPQMVKIKIEGYAMDIPEGETFNDSEPIPTNKLRTIVYLPRSWGMKEPKTRNSSPKYFKD